MSSNHQEEADGTPEKIESGTRKKQVVGQTAAEE